jgi:hypothetical protein
MKETKVYRIETEQEAAEAVEQFRQDQMKGGYTVGKNGYVMKVKKDRKTGEIVEQYALLTVEKKYEVE